MGALRGFRDALARWVLQRRYRLMLALLLVMSWLAMDVYHARVVQDLPVAVLDLDNSKVSRTIRTYVAAAREVRVVADTPASVEEARQMMVDGRITAIVLIPDGLSAAVKAGRKEAVTLAVDTSNILLGRNVYRALAKAVGTVSAGVQLQVVTKLGERREQAMGKVAPIAVDENFTFNPATNYAVYLVPGLTFFILHVFVLLATLSLFLPANRPRGPGEWVGAFAATGLLGFGLGMLFLTVWLPRQGIVPEAGLGMAAAWVAALVGVDLLMGAAFACVVPSLLLAFQVTVVVGMLSMMLAGITWPPDQFPPILAAAARWVPFTPFARGLQVFLHYPASWADIAGFGRDFGRQAVLFAALAAGGAGVRAAAAAVAARRAGGAS